MRRFLIHILGILLLAASIHAQDSIVQQKELWQGPLTLSPGFSSSQVISGICGAPLASPMEVLITDKSGLPVPGIQVAFRIIVQPDQEDAILNPQLAITDSLGLARSELVLGSKPGTYRISARIEEGFPDNEVIFIAKASRKNWVWILIISLFGGLGLFLFGMHTMSEGMQKSAGERLRSILENVTRNRIVGAGIGACCVYLFGMIKDMFAVTALRWVACIFVPQLYLLAMGVGLMLGKAIAHWNGNPSEILLLKLLEDRLHKDTG